jgi:hypothetical protein
MAEESFVILNDVLITGVQSIEFSTDETQEATLLLNATGYNRKIASPATTKCNINKLLVNNDFIKTITGLTNISGQFIHNGSALNFNDAAISNYSFSVTNQSLPTITFSIDIFGDFKTGTPKTLGSMTAESGIVGVDVTGFGINVDNNTNFIQNFNYSVNFDVRPTYQIDSIKSSTVKIVPPINYTANATFEFNDQSLEDVTGLLTNETFDRTVTFKMTGENGSQICNLEIPSASLKSQSISQSASDTEQISLSYVGYGT